MCFSNGRMTPPTIPTHADTHTQAYTALVRLGHSAVAFPKLGIQCLMCFLLTMPMRKENVPCALCPVCPGGVEWHVKHATAPIWASPCHHSVVFQWEYWLLLWTEKLSADLVQLTEWPNRWAIDLVPWPQALKVMTLSKMIRNIYAILFFIFCFSYPPLFRR